MTPKVFSLGALTEPESIYTDTALTKKEIAKLSDVSRQTVVKWDKLAMQVSAYRQEYPLNKGKRVRTVPLTPYQVWVISRVGFMMNTLKDSRRVLQYIAQNPSFFSLARYEFKCQQLSRKRA